MTAGSYLRHFLILFALSGAVIFMWARTDLFPWIGACSGAGYSDDHYLAYCESGRYGDYEHGALLYEMEAAAIEPIKRAEVLFLGNSRTQYTFSSPPVIEAMNATGRPWYVMGFGFGAKSEMPQAMIERLGLTPRMLVINADPFFNDTPSGISQKIIAGGDDIVTEYQKKQWLQGLHQRLCADWGDSVLAPLLCGSSPTLFRARSDGTWNVEHYRPDRHIAVTYSDHLMDELSDTVAAAESFIDGHSLTNWILRSYPLNSTTSGPSTPPTWMCRATTVGPVPSCKRSHPVWRAALRADNALQTQRDARS